MERDRLERGCQILIVIGAHTQRQSYEFQNKEWKVLDTIVLEYVHTCNT